MLRYLLDTDHMTLLECAHPEVAQRFSQELPGTVGISVVTAEERLRGRLAAVARARTGAERLRAYELFLQQLRDLQSWDVVAYLQTVEDQFQLLLAQRIRIGTQDLKIAATALANNLVVATRNLRDFGRVPGLTCEDWSL